MLGVLQRVLQLDKRCNVRMVVISFNDKLIPASTNVPLDFAKYNIETQCSNGYAND